jgi:hypothetical protein
LRRYTRWANCPAPEPLVVLTICVQPAGAVTAAEEPPVLIVTCASMRSPATTPLGLAIVSVVAPGPLSAEAAPRTLIAAALA